MVAYYDILGQKIGSHWLSIGTLSTAFVGIWALSGGQKKLADQGPPINATSKEEENFVQEFLRNADSEAGKREGGNAKH